MNPDTLRAFFGWCTIINGALLILTTLLCSLAGDWVYRMHIRWFPIPRESFNLAIYCFIGVMKLAVITLNLVPYLVLLIVA